jgi:O-methyltransferase involved in polyketide biosynthesis
VDDVAATARTTASIRARETARPDAVFRDPLAEVLAGPEATAALQAMPDECKPTLQGDTVYQRGNAFGDGAEVVQRVWPEGHNTEVDAPPVILARAVVFEDQLAVADYDEAMQVGSPAIRQH